MNLAKIAVGVLVAGCAVPGFAAKADPEPELLTRAFERQLERWLDMGKLDFAAIYVKDRNDKARDFHEQVDGKGPTFTLIEVFDGNDRRVIGGYNPVSWQSLDCKKAFFDCFVVTPRRQDRDGFLYNLTAGTMYPQVTSNDNGRFLTYNERDYGPTFGGGFDLYLDRELDGGTANIGFSFGDPARFGTAAYRSEFAGSLSGWTAGRLEVYTFSVTPIPEPSTYVLVGAGVLAMFAVARRRTARR